MPQTKSQKRESAEERQAHHDTLTTAQKILKARSRRGESRKEIERLREKS